MRRAAALLIDFCIAAGLQVSGIVNFTAAVILWSIAGALAVGVVATWPPVADRLVTTGRRNMSWSLPVVGFIGAAVFIIGWLVLLRYYAPSGTLASLDLRVRTAGSVHFLEYPKGLFVVVENLSITNRAPVAVVLECELSLEVSRGHRVFLQPVAVDQLPLGPQVPRSGYIGPVVNVPAFNAAHGHFALVLERIVPESVWPSVGNKKSGAVFSTLLLGVRDQLTGRTADFRIPLDTAGP